MLVWLRLGNSSLPGIVHHPAYTRKQLIPTHTVGISSFWAGISSNDNIDNEDSNNNGVLPLTSPRYRTPNMAAELSFELD